MTATTFSLLGVCEPPARAAQGGPHANHLARVQVAGQLPEAASVVGRPGSALVSCAALAALARINDNVRRSHACKQ